MRWHLNIFGIKEYNETNVNEVLNKLYLRIKECDELTECINMLSSYVQSNDELIGLVMLFSYDLMYITHKCICEYLVSGKIMTQSISELKKAI